MFSMHCAQNYRHILLKEKLWEICTESILTFYLENICKTWGESLRHKVCFINLHLPEPAVLLVWLFCRGLSPQITHCKYQRNISKYTSGKWAYFQGSDSSSFIFVSLVNRGSLNPIVLRKAKKLHTILAFLSAIVLKERANLFPYE